MLFITKRRSVRKKQNRQSPVSTDFTVKSTKSTN